MSIQERVMAWRQQADLRLAFIVPGRDDPFVCYPKDEVSRTEWLAKAEQQGWRALHTA
jgi:hypothetical protein